MDSIEPWLDPDIPAHDAPPERFRLRNETDLVALVVTTLGFHPTESIVMVCVDEAGRMFQARCDLAPSAVHVRGVVDSLLDAGARNGGRTTFLVTFTADERRSRQHLRATSRALRAAGCVVAMRLRVHDGRWFPASGQPSSATRRGVAFDLTAHPLMARMVLRGEVMLADRDALVHTLDPAPGPEADAVASSLEELGELDLDDRGVLRGESEWLGRVLGEAPETWSPATVARVLRGIRIGDVRDVALHAVDRPSAAIWVRVWRRVVRLAPAHAVAAPAALLGFAAWGEGDGALAWCGVERAFEVDPAHSLARLVADLLVHAVPPDALDRLAALDPPGLARRARPA